MQNTLEPITISPFSTLIFLACLVLVSLAPDNLTAKTGIPAPEITNTTWLNGNRQRVADLRGQVVLVEFWTFGCFNCRNIEPYVKEWHHKYNRKGLTVIAIHSPEFSYERSIDKVQDYIRTHQLPYTVPIDNDFVTWQQYKNRYWPTLYLIDKKGFIQYVKIGEGGYDETDRQIQRLLAEPYSPRS